MKTRIASAAILTLILVMMVFPAFSSESQSSAQAAQAPERLVIEGLVQNPLNISYAELWNMPLVSEVTGLQCVGASSGTVYNWTGVPLFYLLSMAKVSSGTYRKVVFNATDGFNSDITLETAMDPTTILALMANGTDLNNLTTYPFKGCRIVLPCRWGYKWVKWVKQIIVVDYDYKGIYEQVGYSDEAIIPDCTMPLTVPPYQKFVVSKSTDYYVQVLTTGSVESFNFMSDRLVLNVHEQGENSGYLYAIFPEELLGRPYQFYVASNRVTVNTIGVGGEIYTFFVYGQNKSIITVEVRGTPTLATQCSGPYYTWDGIEYWIMDTTGHPTRQISKYT
jgi:hypothetical protein